jgi:N-acetylneuraminic acid mutarotase
LICGHATHRESEQIMARFPKLRPAVLVAAASAALALASSSGAGPTLPGSWRHISPAPFTLEAGVTSAWTGNQVVVAGLTPRAGHAGLVNAIENAAAYNPATNTWRRLPHPPATPNYCRRDAVSTGSIVLVWSCRATAYSPTTDTWRRLPNPPTGHGFALWTGREVIGWGGGCCGDAGADGSAYNPATNTWRKLAHSPLAPEQSPMAVWDGREVLVFVSGISASNGKPLPPALARGAAYNPSTNRWRVLAKRPVVGGAAVWDGHEMVVVAAGKSGRVTQAYNPATNSWRLLAPSPHRRAGATPVWTGSRVIVSGGYTDPSATTVAKHALAFGPRTSSWSTLAPAPMRPRDGSQVAWTGRQLVVLLGVIPAARGSSSGATYVKDGAAFTPAGL